MKRTNILFYLRSVLMMIAVCATALPAQALGQKELQQLLDGNRTVRTNRASNDGFTEIDLSDFTEPITETLYVRNQNIRFVNGTLTKAEALSDPLIQILNGYTLDLAATAKLAGKVSEKALVDVLEGELIINGGEISQGTSNRAINPDIYKSWYGIYVIELSGGTKSRFSMNSGTVYEAIKNITGGRIGIYGGEIGGIYSSGTFTLKGNATVPIGVRLYDENSYITLASPLQYGLDIFNYAKDQLVMKGYTAIPGGGYFVTIDDAQKLRLEQNFNHYRLVYDDHSDGAVFVREAGLDYNNITNEDDLQKALDEIAAQNPSTPVDLTIAPEGIDLTKSIRAKADCKASISGGPIRVVGNGNSYFTGDALFFIQGKTTLALHDIIIDFQQAQLNADAFSVASGGRLSIYNNVSYQNVAENTIRNYAEFYYNSGYLDIESGNLPHISGRVLTNGSPYNSSLGTVYLKGDLFDQPTVYNKAGSTIVFDTSVSSVWTFEGDWEKYELEKAFIMKHGDDLAASDYWQMRFTGLPSTEYHRTVYYDGSSHSIKLKNYNCLQCMMDGDEDGNVDIPCDGVDVGEDYTPAQRMQWLLDGSDCPGATIDPPTIWLPGGCMFMHNPTIVRNITFDSFSSGHRLYIRNKTELKDKVVARNFIWFSIIEQGGHLIWDNAETENVLYPIYNTGGTAEVKGGNLTGTVYNAGTLVLCGCVQVNEIQVMPQSIIRVTSPITSTWVLDLTFDENVDYPNGYTILEGDDGYTLTDDDFAHLQFRLPAGCFVTYDPTHNVVVLNSASAIHSIEADPATTKEGVYTLDGRKLQGPATKKSVYIVNGRKAVVK